MTISRRLPPWATVDWMADAACIGTPLGWWFPTPAVSPRAVDRIRPICEACPVVGECLEFATSTYQLGIWAATSDDDRFQLRRKRQRAERLAARAEAV